MVTNAHVVSDDSDITFIKNGKDYKATVLFKNEQNDIAILKTEKFDEPYFSLANNEEYTISDTIYVLGYPLIDILGSEIKVTNGIINSKSGIEGDSNQMQISAQIQPGNSGGPVINRDFQVVGVASSKLSDAYTLVVKHIVAQNVNFAINSDVVNLLSSEYIKPEDNPNYVKTMSDATSATVLILTSKEKYSNAKTYYIEFSYNYKWDVIHYTASHMEMKCIDIETDETIASYSKNYFSVSDIYKIARNQMEHILEQVREYENNLNKDLKLEQVDPKATST